MVVRWKEAKYSQISIYQFFGRQHENRHAIAYSKILRKMAVICKSYKNTLIRVFFHAEFIFALKTEPKPMVFEKYAENRKKKYLLSLFSIFFVIFSISFKQNFLKPNESCLLDRKKPNIAKLVYINFLAVSMKIAMPVRKFSEKRLFSLNTIKIPLLGYFCMQNSFLHWKRSQSLRFLRNMKKIEKNMLSLFSIFCDFLYKFQAKFPKTK